MVSKGILVDGQGNYLPPIKSSLSEGLSIDEFVTTIAAGRRGMVSKSLSTADTGFFYYRLVKSMRDIVVDKTDCGSSEGIRLPVNESQGRFLAKDYGNISKGTLLTDEVISNLVTYYGSKSEVVVRSPITCRSTEGNVCGCCYGVNIAKNSVIEVGSKVGVITGSTMSEIMSQAMLRNFHTAGSTDIKREEVFAESDIDELDTKQF